MAILAVSILPVVSDQLQERRFFGGGAVAVPRLVEAIGDPDDHARPPSGAHPAAVAAHGLERVAGQGAGIGGHVIGAQGALASFGIPRGQHPQETEEAGPQARQQQAAEDDFRAARRASSSLKATSPYLRAKAQKHRYWRA